LLTLRRHLLSDTILRDVLRTGERVKSMTPPRTAGRSPASRVNNLGGSSASCTDGAASSGVVLPMRAFESR
jgi:hypothetical protein